MSEMDRTPRYAPSVVVCKGFSNVPVESYVAHPAGTHKGPIVASMMALECKTRFGSRWYGCEKAWINSELRMVVVGFDSRDEVRRTWEACTVR